MPPVPAEKPVRLATSPDPLSVAAAKRTTVCDFDSPPVEVRQEIVVRANAARPGSRRPYISPIPKFKRVPIKVAEDAARRKATVAETNKRTNRKGITKRVVWIYLRPDLDQPPIRAGFVLEFSAARVDGKPTIVAEFSLLRKHADMLAGLTRRRVVRVKDSPAIESIIFEPTPTEGPC